MMADFDRPLDRAVAGCFVCTGMGLGVSDDPDRRRFTLKGITADGERVAITSLISQTYINDLSGRVNLIGRWVCVTTDDRGHAAHLVYTEESALEEQGPPDGDWRSLFGPPDQHGRPFPLIA